MKRVAFLLAAAMLGACGAEEPDLKQQLRELSQDFRGRVDPLPQVKAASPAPYRAAAAPDPFYPSEGKRR